MVWLPLQVVIAGLYIYINLPSDGETDRQTALFLLHHFNAGANNTACRTLYTLPGVCAKRKDIETTWPGVK